jgi:hypothetical protein
LEVGEGVVKFKEKRYYLGQGAKTRGAKVERREKIREAD